MKENKKKLIYVMLVMAITAGILLLLNYLAVTYFMDNINLFAVLVLVVPALCIGISGFVIGYQLKWNWKKGLCVALALVLISVATESITFGMTGNTLNSIETDETSSSLDSGMDDEFMKELYAELDQKAYEYMLEQGLIAEGEEIYGGEAAIDNAPDDEIVYSEMYVGIQQADPTTELMGNVLIFMIAFGMSFAGGKAQKYCKNKVNKLSEQCG